MSANRDEITRLCNFLDYIGRRFWEPLKKQSTPTLARGFYFGRDGRPLKELWEALARSMEVVCSAMYECAPASPPLKRPRPPRGAETFAIGNWDIHEFRLLTEIARDPFARSVAAMTTKATAWLNLINSSLAGGEGRYFFRGQNDITKELIPRKGRILRERLAKGTWTAPADPYAPTLEELQSLESFITAWPTNPDVDPIDAERVLAPTDCGWWSRMQHYDPSDATRLLDVTTSLHHALLFACISWSTGRVKDSDFDTDGIVYMFPEGGNSIVIDAEREKRSAADLFASRARLCHFVVNLPENERSKAQLGAFVWWPQFWEPPPVQINYIRVPKESKRQIAKELLSFGIGPAQVMRGDIGRSREAALRADLWPEPPPV